MGVKKENDGRYSVGMGVQNGNEYKGSQGWRDIFIQLTADGATEDSIEKLEFLRDYAIYHSGEGNPVMPPSVNVWISNNGTTTAVEADDIAYTDGVYTICGIKCSGDSWDFSNAGQGGGGGGGLPAYTSADAGKSLVLAEDPAHTVASYLLPVQTVTLPNDNPVQVDGAVADTIVSGDVVTVSVDGEDYTATANVTTGDYGGINITASYVNGQGQSSYVFICDITNSNGVWTANVWEPQSGTHTIAVSREVPTVSPVWGNSGNALVLPTAMSNAVTSMIQSLMQSATQAGVPVKASNTVFDSSTDAKEFIDAANKAVENNAAPIISVMGTNVVPLNFNALPPSSVYAYISIMYTLTYTGGTAHFKIDVISITTYGSGQGTYELTVFVTPMQGGGSTT